MQRIQIPLVERNRIILSFAFFAVNLFKASPCLPMVQRTRQARTPAATDIGFPSITTLHIAIDNISILDIVNGMMNDKHEVEALLPLPPATFHILTALGDGPMHGYAIIQELAGRTGGEIRMSAGTLYRSIQRMQENGLVVESRRRPAPKDDDERRIYYEITPFGSQVVRAELRRLTRLIKFARAKGFAPSRA